MEYTKGEWRVVNHQWKGKTEDMVIHVETAEDVVAEVYSEANASLIAAAPRLYKELKEADRVICELCKRLNPQHATADHGKGCDWCVERDSRLEALTKAECK